MTALQEDNVGQKDLKIDESLPFFTKINSSVTVDDHIEYVIVVEQKGTQWDIQRRYTDFRLLHQNVTSSCGQDDLDFPKKKMTGNKDREFVATRQVGLQHFLYSLTTHPTLRHSLMLKKFLNPVVFSANLNGEFYYPKDGQNSKILFFRFSSTKCFNGTKSSPKI